MDEVTFTGSCLNESLPCEVTAKKGKRMLLIPGTHYSMYEEGSDWSGVDVKKLGTEESAALGASRNTQLAVLANSVAVSKSTRRG